MPGFLSGKIWPVRGEPLVSCTFSLEPTSIMALQGSEFASRANTWAVSRRARGWMDGTAIFSAANGGKLRIIES